MTSELNPLEQYASYPFSTDDEYQDGLASIVAGGALDNNPPEDIKEEILRRTRVFYFNRVTGNAITSDEAREYELSHPGTTASTSAAAVLAAAAAEPVISPSSESESETTPESTGVLSFAQLKALIESGREELIPNNKIIPDGLNEAEPSTSAAPVRKKPWETAT
ncbi:hypothetical protein FB45DRAFT_918075 [Roridomyces roridus]|uniref:Uncharacterized protein n=1 Tax=Roridomyces roridus TaxID=1738132 RepID=A0AAD7BR18_9AGAR|nr:hypothetical protein FB45DRAFT_918075 [Roridomyces roridus]